MVEGEHRVTLDLDDSTITIPRDRRLRKVYLEFSSRCNLQCPMCFRESLSEPQGDMNPSLFEKLVLDLKSFPRLEMVHFLGMGEPFCNPSLFDAFAMLKSTGAAVRLTTNTATLDAEAAREIVSLGVDIVDLSLEAENIPWPGRADGAERALSAALELKRVKTEKGATKPDVRLALVATRSNLEQISPMLEAASGLGISTASVSNLLPTDPDADANRLYPLSLKEERRLRRDLFTRFQRAGIKPELPRFALSSERHCVFVKSESCFIRWDGKVSPCLRLGHEYREIVLGRAKRVDPYFFGDINQEHLVDIWDSVSYVCFRWRLRRALYASCLDCSLVDVCEYAKNTESDCWGDSPACSDCLWDRNLIRCP